MKKLLIGALSTLSCLLVLAAALAVILATMAAIDNGIIHMLYALAAVPLVAVGAALYKWIDNYIDRQQ